jgi:hypothetical protein
MADWEALTDMVALPRARVVPTFHEVMRKAPPAARGSALMVSTRVPVAPVLTLSDETLRIACRGPPASSHT